MKKNQIMKFLSYSTAILWFPASSQKIKVHFIFCFNWNLQESSLKIILSIYSEPRVGCVSVSKTRSLASKIYKEKFLHHQWCCTIYYILPADEKAWCKWYLRKASEVKRKGCVRKMGKETKIYQQIETFNHVVWLSRWCPEMTLVNGSG